MSRAKVVYYISATDEYMDSVSLLEPYIMIEQRNPWSGDIGYKHYPLEQYDDLVERGILERVEKNETTTFDMPVLPTLSRVDTYKPDRDNEVRMGKPV